MLRSGFKIQILSRTFNGCYLGNLHSNDLASNLVGQTKSDNQLIKSKINLSKINSSKTNSSKINSSEINSPKLSSSSQSNESTDDFSKVINQCEKFVHIQNLLRYKLNEIKADHLKTVFDRIKAIFYQSERSKSLYQFNKFQESPELDSLLDLTNELINNLDTNCLISAFQVSEIIVLDPRSVEKIINQLKTRLTELNFEQCIECLKILNHYIEKSRIKNQLIQLERELIKESKFRILNNKIDQINIDTIALSFYIFLRPEIDPNFQIIDRLVDLLLSVDSQLEFKQSVRILKRIRDNYSLFKSRQLNTYENRANYMKPNKKRFPQNFNKLIEKCNSSIRMTFKLNPTDENFYYFMTKIHNRINSMDNEFDNFYDPKLLDLFSPYLLNFGIRYGHYVYPVCQNYAKFNVYNENLLKLLYEIYCRYESIRTEISPKNFYCLISKYRLPFVNHQYLASKMFDYSDSLKKSMNHSTNSLRMICELILNDVNDEKLFAYLIQKIDNIDQKYYNLIGFKEFQLITIARAYLLMFGQKNVLRSSTKSRLDRSIELLSRMGIAPIVGLKFQKLNNKIQKTGYLSNGLFVNAFLVYDKSVGDFISLARYENYFNQIDYLPLRDDQEIVTFVSSNRVNRDFADYEPNVNYRMKKILKNLKIRPIEVFEQDYKFLSNQNQAEFFIRLALKNCQTPDQTDKFIEFYDQKFNELNGYRELIKEWEPNAKNATDFEAQFNISSGRNYNILTLRDQNDTDYNRIKLDQNDKHMNSDQFKSDQNLNSNKTKKK